MRLSEYSQGRLAVLCQSGVCCQQCRIVQSIKGVPRVTEDHSVYNVDEHE